MCRREIIETMLNQSKSLTLNVESRVEALLEILIQTYSHVGSGAYETAWLARLHPYYPEYGFDSALNWLRANQHGDGSWGSPIFHYHDRIISTLSAMIALREVGKETGDEERIKLAERFLWRNSTKLHHDAMDTIGFQVLIVALLQDVKRLGLVTPQNLFSDAEKIEKKLNSLSFNPETWRFSTLHYSLEAILYNIQGSNTYDFADHFGCVGASPSATVATLMQPNTGAERSLNYLANLVAHQGDGGIPTVDEIDIFEAAWSLNILRAGGVITPDDPAVRPTLDYLWDVWLEKEEKGVGFSRYFNVPDLDDTAVAFTVLRWGGYPAKADIFEAFEQEEYFVCFPHEIGPSTSVNLRMLVALQFAQEHPSYPRWHDKIVRILRRWDMNGYFWFDKWHASPYYLTAPSIGMLHGIIDDILPSRIQWIIQTQNADGGWGYYHKSTIEETAYCIDALLYWHEHIEPLDAGVLETGIQYLLEQLENPVYEPMWIGKGLYTPYKVVQASTLTALNRIQRYLEA